MNMKTAIVLAAAALATTTAVTASAGSNAYSLTATGSWNDAGTWTKTAGPDADTYPDGDDIANANGAFTVTVDSNAAAGQLYISNAGAKVVVDSTYELAVNSGSISVGSFEINGGKFIINNNGGSFTVTAGAALLMKGSSPVLEINPTDGFKLLTATSKLEIQGDAVIQGTGSLRGDSSGADIVLNVGNTNGVNVSLTLASGTTAHGGMAVQRAGTGNGSATFDNQGLVKADNSLTINFADDLTAITDAGSSCATHWRIESGATLQFDLGASLSTSFQIDGLLDDCGCGGVATAGVASGGGSYGCLFTYGTCP